MIPVQSVRGWRVLAATIAVVLCGTAISATHAATAEELQKAIQEKTKLLEEINGQIAKTEQAIEASAKESKSLTKAVREYDYRIQQLKLSVQASETKIDTLRLEIGALQEDIETKETLIERSRDAVARVIRQLDERDRQPMLMTMLGSESLAQSLFAAHAAQRVSTGLADQVRNLKNIREELQGTLTARSIKKASLEVQQRTLSAQQSVTQDQKAQKQELLSQTKQQEKLYQEQLKKLEQQQQEIGAAIDAVEKQLRDSFDPNLLPAKRPGVFQPPVPGAPISQGYGATTAAKKLYKSGFHNGIDFAAPIGTPVTAARAGTVVAVGDNKKYQYGKYVAIAHDNGLSTLYAHLSKQTVAKGDVVVAGDIIGYVGNTGYSYGAHTHFTVYWSASVVFKTFPTCPCGLVPVGVTIDPTGYL